MNRLSDIADGLQATLHRLMPRVLSQACRDPHAASYGCFDRDWWHYKIRDFPSIVLQQGGYACHVASQLNLLPELREMLVALAAASARFWNERAVRHGAFEEYYPWEEGFPPLAFSTLAAMKLAAGGAVSRELVEPGARVAAQQLLARFEPQAANQQVAALAALAWLRKNFPKEVPDAEFQALKEKTLRLQHAEGWFEEYGGADLGYLSVTIDGLWDLFDATGDAAYVQAAERALRFIAWFVPLGGTSIGMHNARNTDYILPYGICRFAAADGPARGIAAALLGTLYGRITSPGHFVQALDDRYLCHYTGHSLLRGLLVLRGLTAEMPAPALQARDQDLLLEGSGHYLRCTSYSSLLSLRKGGILSCWKDGASLSDLGWIVEIGDEQHVSHWQSAHWQWTRDGDAWVICGHLVPTRERASSPARHLALRAGAWLFGRRIIPALKDRLIFSSAASPCMFERRVQFGTAEIHIIDRITDVPDGAQVISAPRASKRHVASADSFHDEDAALVHGVQVERREQRSGNAFTAETVYRIG